MPAGVTEKDVQLFTQAQDNAKEFLTEENKSLTTGDENSLSPTANGHHPSVSRLLATPKASLPGTPKAGQTGVNGPVTASPALSRVPVTPKTVGGTGVDAFNTPARTPCAPNKGNYIFLMCN